MARRDRAVAGDLERLDERGIEREYALDADAGGDAAHGEVGRGSLAVAEAYDHALEGLDALALALADAEVHADGIACGESRNAGVGFGLVNFSGVHRQVSVNLLLWGLELPKKNSRVYLRESTVQIGAVPGRRGWYCGLS